MLLACLKHGIPSIVYYGNPQPTLETEKYHIYRRTEIDELIAGSGRKTLATFRPIPKDSGARRAEIARIDWSALDFKTLTINSKAEKRSNGRVLPLTKKTIGMMSNLKRKKRRKNH